MEKSISLSSLLSPLSSIIIPLAFAACGDDEADTPSQPTICPVDTTTIVNDEIPILYYTVPSTMTIGEETTITGLGFADGDSIGFFPYGATKAINQTPVTKVKAIICAEGVSLTVPETLEAGTNYTVLLCRNGREWEMGHTAITSARMRIASIVFKDATGRTTFNLTYDEQRRLAKIATDDYNWNFAYSGNTVTTECHMSRESVTSLTFTLNEEGNVTQSTAANAYLTGKYADNETNTWYYDGDGKLDSIVNGSRWYTADLKNTYADNQPVQTVQMECGGNYYYRYDGSLEVPGGTLPPTMLCDLLTCMRYSEDGVIGMLLSQSINHPTQIPTQMGMEYQANQATGETAVEYMKVTATMDNDVLTITTARASNNSVGFQGSTVTVTYEKQQ